MRFLGRVGSGLNFWCLVSLALLVGQSSSGEARETGQERVRQVVSGVRVPFVANSGQTDPAVAYYAPTFAGTVFVTTDGRIVYSLPGKRASASGGRSVDRELSVGWSLTESAVGARVRPSGVDRAPTGVSYFLGTDPARWRIAVPTFEGVSLGQVWPGIALDLRAHGRSVEKVFTVEPGADPSRIRMSVAGALKLRIDRAGALIASTDLGDVTFTPPAAYQERRGVRHLVPVAYQLRGRQYGFRLGGYDPTLPVVIDPLLQATYLGGGGFDTINSLAFHPVSGDVYVTGATASTDFPGTAGGAQPVNGGFSLAFVARLNAGLTTLKQATYLGGSGGDEIASLAIHPISGDVYVTGGTYSADFPGTAGGAQPDNGGFADGFVARLNAALTTLKQATYLGGTDFDGGGSIAIHPVSGDVYVGGYVTESTDFPGTAGGAQPEYGGGQDAWVTRLNEGLTVLKQSTYLGGADYEQGNSLAIHPTSGAVYLAGATRSSDFPGTAGGAQAEYGGGQDAFIARLSEDLTTLDQATYLGGSSDESSFSRDRALRIHPASGDVYLAGDTQSSDFPGTTGGAQAASGGAYDGFVACVNAALTTLKQATYIGGHNQDLANTLAIHPTSGDLYVAGFTASANFPGTTGGAQSANAGGYDNFVARVNAGLTTLKQATYLGGSNADLPLAVEIHPASGDVYVAGGTFSTDFPGTTGGAQATNNGSSDVSVARLTADLAAGVMTALGPAEAWVGLKNSDDVGLKLDLLIEVFVNTTKVGQGQLNSVSGGGSGFNGAILNMIPLGLTGGPVSIDASNALKLKISARRTCFGAGHNSGTARLWYNGRPIDSGSGRDAGTRFDATISGSTRSYFPRGGFALNKVAGSSKLSVDKFVNSSAPCPARPFTEFGTWSITSP